MTHQEKSSGWRSYDAMDCKSARKSLRYYKKKAHKKLRQVAKMDMTINEDYEYEKEGGFDWMST
jgi:hypothetical protein